GENSLITQGRDGMSPYHTLFYNYCQRNFGVSSQEMMWQIAQLGESTNSDFGIYNGQPGCMGGPFGGRKTLQVKLPTYYLSFDPADMRRDVICANYSITFLSDAEKFDGTNCATTFSSIMPGKYRIQWCQAPQAAAKRNVDVPLLRYADILLMYAETQNYLHGPNDAAKAALKQVRDRAGIGAMPIAAANKEEFLETIMQERKWELGDELLVRGDLIRMNLIEKEVRQAQQDIK
ncbi:RagB/SusD family nutrient uptake outer membrane protein, partial [Duncaniella muris]